MQMINRWKDKCSIVHPSNGIFVRKKKKRTRRKALAPSTTRVTPGSTTRSKAGCTRSRSVWLQWHWASRVSKPTEIERSVIASGGRGGRWGMEATASGYEVSLGATKTLNSNPNTCEGNELPSWTHFPLGSGSWPIYFSMQIFKLNILSDTF